MHTCCVHLPLATMSPWIPDSLEGIKDKATLHIPTNFNGLLADKTSRLITLYRKTLTPQSRS